MNHVELPNPFDDEAPREPTHWERIERLQLIGMPIDGALRGRLMRSHYGDARGDEELARDEAEIAALEAGAAPFRAKHECKRRSERLMRLDLPITESDCDLLARDQLEQTRTVKAVRAWFDDGAPLIVLSGTVGRGKTLAAANALLHVGGRYVRALELARLYLAQFGAEVEQREELVRERRLLVIDDIGVERNAEVMGVALLEVLDARRRGQRTIWITNLDRRAFEARYGDARLLSRIGQSAKWLSDAGDDLRRGDRE